MIQLPYTMSIDHQFILDIIYDGAMVKAQNDNLKNKGFMLGSYDDDNSDPESYIFTEFEPTKARKCFPCFDEPAIKSHFNLQIDHDSSYNAIANMPVISRVQSNKTISHVTTIFRETPKMSTYLIAFVVSKFKHFESNAIGIPQKLYARPSLIDEGKVNFVGIHLDKMLKTAEDYFQVPYSLPKMDHVVAPNYFSAIENWGLNGYSEEYVLELDKTGVFLCFLHEIAHHYFGNLVTPKWWTHMWMKEGFAKHYEIELAKLIFPELKKEVEAYREFRYQTALAVDSEKYAKPLNYYVEAPDEISKKFLYSPITYLKAASVINMFENSIGTETWKRGMKFYIESYQYSSTEPGDLYEAIQKVVDEELSNNTISFKDAMSSWIDQAGFPTISARLENGTLKLSQKRKADSGKNEIYTIPIFYVSSSDPECSKQTAKFWMTEKEMKIENFNDDWIIINCKSTGYYDVEYDINIWNGIINQLNKNHTVIPKSFRKKLVRTILKNSETVFWDCKTLNQILNYLYVEEDLDSIAVSINLLYNHFGECLVDETFSANFKSLVENVYKDIRQYGQYAMVKKLACSLKVQICISDSIEGLINVINSHIISSDFPYCDALKHANKTIVDIAYKFVLDKSSDERVFKLIYGLGCIEDAQLYRKALNIFLDRDWDIKYFYVSYLLNNLDSHMKKEAWLDFLEMNHAKIVRRPFLKQRLLINLRSNVRKFPQKARLQNIMDNLKH
ncbi:unnamed protein product [Chironomus riparius]|uniref:Aminopeptidase n=1 Tax=Chironomus riparius TaxID=315576 RepID=A0A9N9WM24_9DIPT|nr:unnamed protein product [Chironomus riparius]